MARWLVSALVITLIPIAAAADPGRRHGLVDGDRYTLATPPGTALQVGAPVRVFLNASGGTLVSGEDDPGRGRSWIARSGDGGRVQVPPYPQRDRAWGQVVACVRDHFAPFAVDVVDQRPAAGAYTMMMVGGSAALIGQPASVGGIAPSGSGVLRNAVGYAFVDGDDRPAETCATIAHEIGHTLGLDHSTDCHDLMSYGDCGPKAFTNRATSCGEYDARACDDGAATQNSFQHLGDAVGWRSSTPEVATPSPAAEPPPAAGWDDDDGDDVSDEATAAETGDLDDGDGADDSSGTVTAQATLALDLGRTRRRGDRWTTIELRATATAGVAELYLLWATPDETYAWACGHIPDDVPVTCTRDGDDARFELMVGTGPRAVAAVLIDGAGRKVETSIYQLRFR